MRLVSQILLCLITLLRVSGVSADCVYDCCSVSRTEHPNCFSSDDCDKDCPSSPEGESPCDSSCCVAQDLVLLAIQDLVLLAMPSSLEMLRLSAWAAQVLTMHP